MQHSITATQQMPMPAQLLVQGGCGLQYQSSAELVNRLCLLACTHHHL